MNNSGLENLFPDSRKEYLSGTGEERRESLRKPGKQEKKEEAYMSLELDHVHPVVVRSYLQAVCREQSLIPNLSQTALEP